MKRTHVLWIAFLGIALLAIGLAWAPIGLARDGTPQSPPVAGDPPESGVSKPGQGDDPPPAAEAADEETVVFVPPDRGAPRMRVGSATRGDGDALALHALAPEQVGLTLAAQPVIYWYVSAPSERPVNFTLRRTAAANPLAEFALEPPQAAGLQVLRLADHGVRLKPEVDYQWFVSLAGDGGESEAVAGGGIAFVTTSPELAASLAAASASERARVLAGAGIWYDTVDALAQRVADAPEDAPRRLRLARLLEQVGLVAVARAERDRAAGYSDPGGADAIALPIYSPPKPVRASYPRNLAGLGARGTESGAANPRLYALAPNHLGVSVRAQPTLYWYLEADTALAASFTLIAEGATQPLLELAFPAPIAAGYHAVRLAEHGVNLTPGTRYDWTAALVSSERHVHPTISQGFIEYREAEPDLARELATAGAGGAVHAYARRGLWYDAFDDLSGRIGSDPNDPVPQLQRAALLDQVGLTPVASHERARAARNSGAVLK